MSADPKLIAAQAQAEAAKLRFFSTLGEVQVRIKPSTLAHDAMESASEGIATAARKGADVARARPAVTAGAAGLFALFLARKPICRLVRGRRRDETATEAEHLNHQEAPTTDAGKGS